VKIRNAIISVIVALLFLAVPIARGGGVTVITHGLNGNADGWVTGMADQINNNAAFPGTNYTIYKLYYYYSGGNYIPTTVRLAGSQPSSTDSGEIIVALDWSQLADGNSFNTYQIATSVASVLQNPNFIAEMNGHALCELPLHLIGHSRGGSLISEVSQRLGTNGVWVDHLTTLDPHPLNNDGFDLDFLAGWSAIDAPVRTYLNVLFHDNYWQDSALFVYGEPVFGAYIRKLYNLSGGYQNIGDTHYPHSNVHLWYHGTVDERNPANDSEASITGAEFSNWYFPYENAGFNAGFIYSLIGGGDRTSTNRPLGTGYPAIREGLNQAWDFGAGVTGNRNSLPANNGAWPNIVKFDILGTHTVPAGTSVSMKYFCQFGTSTNQSTNVSVYLDQNANPYDGNSGLITNLTEFSAGLNRLHTNGTTFSFNTTNTPPGQYYVCAKISFGGHARYMYAPGKLTITDATPPYVSITNPASAKTYTNAQTVTISANATDNVAVASVSFYDNGVLKGTDTSTPYTYDWSFTGADNGTNSWTARAYDTAGNVSTSSAVALTVSIDITPPTVAMASPTNGQLFTTSAITVSGTASDTGSPSSGLAGVEVRVNGGSWSNATGTSSWTRSVTLPPCNNTIEARSRDNAGNYSTIASNFVFYTPPNTAPNTPSNVSPASGATSVAVAPTLQAGPFSDPDCVGDTHAASQWQVLDSAGAVAVADSGTDIVNKVSWSLPASTLQFGSNYQWHVRYRDSRNGWSSYSPQTVFMTIAPLLSGTKQGTNIVFKWPTNTLGFNLQSSTNFGATLWSNAAPAPVIVNGQYTVTNSMTNKFKLYRLKKP